MTHQTRPPELKHEFPELELSLKLSQLEGTFKFLDYMNNGKTVTGEDFPRNLTERNSVDRSLARIQECRNLFKQIVNKHNVKPASSVSNEQLAHQQFIYDS